MLYNGEPRGLEILRRAIECADNALRYGACSQDAIRMRACAGSTLYAYQAVPHKQGVQRPDAKMQLEAINQMSHSCSPFIKSSCLFLKNRAVAWQSYSTSRSKLVDSAKRQSAHQKALDDINQSLRLCLDAIKHSRKDPIANLLPTERTVRTIEEIKRVIEEGLETDCTMLYYKSN